MPAGGQTWVHMAFVKEGKVTANKLNVRAGGSETVQHRSPLGQGR